MRTPTFGARAVGRSDFTLSGAEHDRVLRDLAASRRVHDKSPSMKVLAQDIEIAIDVVSQSPEFEKCVAKRAANEIGSGVLVRPIDRDKRLCYTFTVDIDALCRPGGIEAIEQIAGDCVAQFKSKRNELLGLDERGRSSEMQFIDAFADAMSRDGYRMPNLFPVGEPLPDTVATVYKCPKCRRDVIELINGICQRCNDGRAV